MVSVIIPAYNAAPHIAAALSSVFAQSLRDFEVIVVNDGSPDTPKLDAAIAPHLSRIVYLKKENGGPSSARNLGILRARGEWLAFLDSDDSWMPNYLAEQFRFLNEDPARDMVFCDAILRGDGKVEGKTFMQLCPSAGPVTFAALVAERIQPITSGTVIRREKVLQAGLFDEAIHCSEDHDLWLRVLHAGGKIAYHALPLLYRNVRAGSQGADPGNLLAGEIQTLIKLGRDLTLSGADRAAVQLKLTMIQGQLSLLEGKKFLLAGDTDKAYQSFSCVDSLTPSGRTRVLLLGLRFAPTLVIFLARMRNRGKTNSSI
jgi:glycosyltransferase involved in cell wall biosynthesis